MWGGSFQPGFEYVHDQKPLPPLQLYPGGGGRLYVYPNQFACLYPVLQDAPDDPPYRQALSAVLGLAGGRGPEGWLMQDLRRALMALARQVPAAVYHRGLWIAWEVLGL